MPPAGVGYPPSAVGSSYPMIIGEIRGQQTSQMALAENDDVVQTLAPVPPGVSEQYPKESISRTERRTLDRALEHRQLLTEGQVLKRDCAVSAADQGEGTEQNEKRGQHERSCVAIVQRINGSLTIRVVANDRCAAFRASAAAN